MKSEPTPLSSYKRVIKEERNRSNLASEDGVSVTTVTERSKDLVVRDEKETTQWTVLAFTLVEIDR